MQETTYVLPTLPCSIALLADFHNSDPEPVMDIVARRNPQIICIAGDLMMDIGEQRQSLRDPGSNVLPLLDDCVRLAPTFLSLGNHESCLRKKDLSLLSSTGCHVLDNRFEVFGNLVIGGLTSGRVLGMRAWRASRPGLPHTGDLRRERGKKPPDLEWLNVFFQQEGYHILLCHHPEYYPRYLKNLPLDLVLSGHAHGGQWRFLGQGVFAPDQGLFPPLTSGVHDGKLVISRGMTNTKRIPRINNPPEVVFLTPEGSI